MLGMHLVADSHRKRVARIGRDRFEIESPQARHRAGERSPHLFLVGCTESTNGFFDRRRGVLPHRHVSTPEHGEQRTARLGENEQRAGILVVEQPLDHSDLRRVAIKPGGGGSVSCSLVSFFWGLGNC